MSKLEEIRSALEIMEKTVVVDFSKTQDDTKKAFKTVIDLARLILDASEVMPQKKVKSSHMLLSGKYEEVCSCAFKAYNQAISEVRPIVARLKLEKEQLQAEKEVEEDIVKIRTAEVLHRNKIIRKLHEQLDKLHSENAELRQKMEEARKVVEGSLEEMQLFLKSESCDCPPEGHLCGFPRLVRHIEQAKQFLEGGR